MELENVGFQLGKNIKDQRSSRDACQLRFKRNYTHPPLLLNFVLKEKKKKKL